MCQCQQLCALFYLMKATSVLESVFAILLKFQAHELLCGGWCFIRLCLGVVHTNYLMQYLNLFNHRHGSQSILSMI